MPRRCLECPSVGEWGAAGRCPTHRLARQRAKDRTPARRRLKSKYDNAHRNLRRLWVPIVAAGDVTCPRCGELIAGEFDLGHRRDGSLSVPEHPTCNRKAH